MRHLPLAALALLAGCTAAAQEETRCLPPADYLARLHERAGEDLVIVLAQEAALWLLTVNPVSGAWTLGTQRAGNPNVCLHQVGVGVFPPRGREI